MSIMFEISVRNTDQQNAVYAYTLANVGGIRRSLLQNSLCITQSYYARTASGGGKEGGGILYLKKIYDTGFGVYTLLGKAQADY